MTRGMMAALAAGTLGLGIVLGAVGTAAVRGADASAALAAQACDAAHLAEMSSMMGADMGAGSHAQHHPSRP